MWPVEGWIATTIALPPVPLTALRAACSACGLIVVATRLAVGAMTVVWLPGTAAPEASWNWADRPGLPFVVQGRPRQQVRGGGQLLAIGPAGRGLPPARVFRAGTRGGAGHPARHYQAMASKPVTPGNGVNVSPFSTPTRPPPVVSLVPIAVLPVELTQYREMPMGALPSKWTRPTT